MKKTLWLFVTAIILTVSMPQKSHALVGLLVKKKTVTIIGGATTAAGAGVFLLTSTAATLESALLLVFGGMFLGGLGIIILEDEPVEFKFPVMTGEKAEFLGVNFEDMAVYNSELNKLNRVKELIEEDLTEESTEVEARESWTNACTSFLSEQTCAVKAIVADEIMGNLKVAK